MLEPFRQAGLLGWGLGTFHTAFLLLVLLLLQHRDGSLGSTLSGLNTLVGIGLYLLLWLTTSWSTARFVSASHAAQPPLDASEVLVRGMVWGGVSGTLFFLELGLSFLLLSLVNALSSGQMPSDLPGFLVAVSTFVLGVSTFAVVGSAVAFVAGLVVGLLFALLDAALLALAQRLHRACTVRS